MLPKALRSVKGGGVFYLHGADEYRKAEAAKSLVEHYADPATRDFNLDRLRGSEVSVPQLASVIATPPMLAEWRVVHVTEAEAVCKSARGREVLLGAAKRPPPGLVLILQATVPPRLRAKIYRDLAKAARAVEFKPVPAHAVPAWLVSWARTELGVELELAAAQAMAGAAGTDVGVLAHEVRKLADMVGGGAPVDVAAVRKGGIRLPQQDRWAWFDLVGNRRIDEALRGLHVLLEQGETPVGLVIGLSAQLMRIGAFLEGGRAALEAMLPPYQRFLAGRIASQARRWTRAELEAAVRGLMRLDQLLKAASLPRDVLMEQWLVQLMVSGRRSSGAA